MKAFFRVLICVAALSLGTHSVPATTVVAELRADTTPPGGQADRQSRVKDFDEAWLCVPRFLLRSKVSRT